MTKRERSGGSTVCSAPSSDGWISSTRLNKQKKPGSDLIAPGSSCLRTGRADAVRRRADGTVRRREAPAADSGYSWLARTAVGAAEAGPSTRPVTELRDRARSSGVSQGAGDQIPPETGELAGCPRYERSAGRRLGAKYPGRRWLSSDARWLRARWLRWGARWRGPEQLGVARIAARAAETGLLLRKTAARSSIVPASSAYRISKPNSNGSKVAKSAVHYRGRTRFGKS